MNRKSRHGLRGRGRFQGRSQGEVVLAWRTSFSTSRDARSLPKNQALALSLSRLGRYPSCAKDLKRLTGLRIREGVQASQLPIHRPSPAVVCYSTSSQFTQIQTVYRRTASMTARDEIPVGLDRVAMSTVPVPESRGNGISASLCGLPFDTFGCAHTSYGFRGSVGWESAVGMSVMNRAVKCPSVGIRPRTPESGAGRRATTLRLGSLSCGSVWATRTLSGSADVLGFPQRHLRPALARNSWPARTRPLPPDVAREAAGHGRSVDALLLGAQLDAPPFRSGGPGISAGLPWE